MKNELILMCGIPGSGKSTWAKNFIDRGLVDVIISRDTIRFSMVAEDEPYFSKEKQVFKIFVEAIDRALEQGLTVVADATHLNRASRLKLLNALTVKPDMIDIFWVNTSLKKALEQNELRKGTRAYVPPEQIEKMYNAFEVPVEREGDWHYDRIYTPIGVPTNER